MALGVSIGDMIAIVQVCYDIGKALTTGNGAPQQFEQFQMLLYSFGEPLKVLQDQLKKPNSVFKRADTAKTLETLMWNAGVTLKQVEVIVNKYAAALGYDVKKNKGLVKTLQVNWKMIRWSDEEPELAKLIQQLTAHQANIILLTSVTNSVGSDEIVAKLEKIQALLSGPGHSCQHTCNNEERHAQSPKVEHPQIATPRKPPGKRPNHPDGLPFVSAERCQSIDNGSFEVQIAEETENGKIVICPSAQIKGSHFLAPRSPGKPREDLFQCNCKQWFGGSSSFGYHAKVLNNYSCGPKTFMAQSAVESDRPFDEAGWWLLQTAVKQGSSKNLFLELKDLEKRPQFAKVVASTLRTNVARNVFLGLIQPFDLVKWAKNGPKPHERLQIAWSYDERTVGRKGLKIRIDKLPWAKEIEFSDTTDDHSKTEKVQDYFVDTQLPGFSWYRVAKFESINKPSFLEDEDVEDAHFFLDHFHTSAELKVKLSDPRNPNNIYWGVGEFGGADLTYSSYSDDRKLADELMFTVSRFTIQKAHRVWLSGPPPVNCSLHFTFRHGYSASVSTLFAMWKRYESLSSLTGPAAEFSQVELGTPTKDNPRFLMRAKNSIFTDYSVTASLDPYRFNPDTTFRNCWLLGRRGYERKSPLNLILRSSEQDIHCHIHLSANDARNLRKSANFLEKSLSFKLEDNVVKKNGETSWGWVYPRDPYGPVNPPGINISGSLKINFSSEPELSAFLNNMRRLLEISEGRTGESITPPPYTQNPGLKDTKIAQPERHLSTIIHQLLKRKTSTSELQPPAAEDSSTIWEKVHTPDGQVRYVESHNLIQNPEVPRRSKTLPSHSEPPPQLKDSATPSSEEPHPGLGRSTTDPQPHQFAYPDVTYNNWGAAPTNLHQPPTHQYTLSPIPGYQSHPEMPAQNLYQPGLYTMQNMNQFPNPNYTAAVEHRMNNAYSGWSGAGHNDYNRIPRGWAEPSPQGPNMSPPQSPDSMFPNGFQAVAHGPPIPNIPLTPQSPVNYQQQNSSNNRVGLKRCIVVSEYESTPGHGEVSLQVGQVYNVIPQHDSPWVWIEAQTPYGPSGFAPARNFREYYY